MLQINFLIQEPKAVVRFFQFFIIKKNKRCWEWKGAKKRGYGVFQLNGKAVIAHRFSYKIFYGELPDDLLVCHKCDNPSCVRPDHLFLGTSKDNSTDRDKKGRGYFKKGNMPFDNKGEGCGNSKLTWGEVDEIRELYKTGRFTQKELGEKYGMGHTIIGAIINNKSWKI